jgi:hypothetical protein
MNKYIKILFIIILFIFLVIIPYYLLGRFHGTMQMTFYTSGLLCNESNRIYPYGCKIDEDANYCLDMDCQSLGYNYNGAVCLKMNKTELNFIEKSTTSFMGLAFTGCPMTWYKIGINKYTCKENWRVNLLKENETCRRLE